MSTLADMETSTSQSSNRAGTGLRTDPRIDEKQMLTGVGVLLAAAANHVKHKRPRCCAEAYQRHLPFQLLRQSSIIKHRTNPPSSKHVIHHQSVSQSLHQQSANKIITNLELIYQT